ncbi:MAG TPA: MFS transporter [Caulobacteraceae bacterium]|jgi:MFS family permease|nr:MFS transporter [Caulobacteraceae bacterium]
MAMTAADDARAANDTARRPGIPAAHVAAVSIGNALEFYDFLTFSLFAVYIAGAFFPGANPTDKLFASLATFWAGFLTRPIGAMVLGPLGDRIGRKPAMLISFVLIGVGMLGLAVTPTYAKIGLWAPALAVFFRLVQGFALGGNVGPTTAYMLEAAPPGRRGFYGAFQYTSQGAAVLASALMGWGLARLLSPHDLAAWGWRIAFFAGVIIVPFGLWLRNRLPETMHAAAGLAEAPDAPSAPRLRERTPVRPYARVIACGFVLLTSGTIVTYVTIYITTYALDTLHMSADLAFGASIVSASVLTAASSVGGVLCDRFGRKPVMLWPTLAAIAVSWPIFWLIVHYPGPLSLFAGIALIQLLASLASAPVIVSLTEGLPPAIRSGGVAIVYAFAISIFGGATQFVLAKAIHATGNPLAPGLFLTVAFALSLPAILAIRESAPGKQRGGGEPLVA